MWHSYQGKRGGIQIHIIIVDRDFPLFGELWDYVNRRLPVQSDSFVPFDGLNVVTLESARMLYLW